MSAWLQRNPLAFALALLAGALLVVLALEVGMSSTERGDAPGKRGKAPEARLLPPVPAVVAEQAYAETTTRPIFVPTRRPAPDVPVAAAPAFQRGQFVLQGVIVAGNTRTAMLREKSSGRVHRVEAGKDINGIKVLQIDPVAVTMGMGEEREVLPLTVQRPGAVPPTAGAAPPPPAVAQGGPFAPPPASSPFPQATAAAAAAQAAGQPFARPPQPGMPGPAAAAAAAPAMPPAGAAGFPAQQPGAPAQANAPMSAEELLARRRARRSQQNQ